MDLVKPGIGLIFWATLTFSLVLFLLGKFAWKPILKALTEREQKISDSLELADKTHKEMEAMQASNEKLLQEARGERERILKEAREMKEQIVAQARKSADEEGRKMIATAKDSIDKEKQSAMNELKTTAALIGVEIAEKIIRKKMGTTQEQEALIGEYLKEFKLN